MVLREASYLFEITLQWRVGSRHDAAFVTVGDKNDRERSENKQPEVRHPKDPAETEKLPTGSMEKEQRQAEEESKKYMEGGDEEKLAREGGKSKEEEAEHQMPAQDETLHTEIKKHYQEIGREEERNYHSEEESKEGKCCEDVEAAVSQQEIPLGGRERG